MSMGAGSKAVDVIDFCADPDCQAAIYFGQKVVKRGKDWFCCYSCLCNSIGVAVIKAGRTHGT